MTENIQLINEEYLKFVQEVAPKYKAIVTVLGRTGDKVVWGDGKKGPITLPNKVQVRISSPLKDLTGFSDDWYALSTANRS